MNKTQQQSIIGQIEFEKKVIEFGCQFHRDYSFKNARSKVLIVDPYGDTIAVSPSTFKKQGKPPQKSVKRDLEEKVIERGWSLSGEYEFLGPSSKVNLICPNGHSRNIAPSKFRGGQGCALCAGNAPYTTKTFIEQAAAVHGERYDYSKTVYPKNNKLKLTITCRKHGDFEQTASDHINQKSGCQRCKADITSIVHSKTHEQFMAKVNAIHGDTYLYNKAKYIKSNQHVTITCRKHGDFEQLPNVHVNGSGCPTCGNIAIAKGQRKTKHQYIIDAKAFHGDYYDYSAVDYVSAHCSIKIICPKHGEFVQNAGRHLTAGCRLCANERSAERQRITTEEFIKQARTIHGEYYDYSLVDYKGNREKVSIICHKHGVFEQIAGSHTNHGSGCIQCGFEATKENQTKSTEQFIIEAQAIHGNIYDYSIIEYKGSLEPVTFICDIHGNFIQKPSVHLSGAGCRKCGFERSHAAKTFSQEDFLERAYTHHQYKYDYSKTVYSRAQDYVTITCRKHGDFEQLANSHMIGMGCRKCGSETLANSMRLSSEEFIAKAQEVHGSKYDYSWVDYKSAKEKVTIKCPKHGEFEQIPSGHLYGGCVQCANEQTGLAQRRTTENFISDAIKIHGELYDYTETEYSTALDKVKIICRTHGVFHQSPRAHIRGSMCPQCSYGKGVGTYDEYYFERNPEERDAPCKFYYVKFTKTGKVRYKVGLDSNDKRWGKNYRGWRIDVIKLESTTKYLAWKHELAILDEFKDYRYRVKDEDFVGNGSTEMFLFDVLGADDTE
jgi:hypothetical protein